MNTEEQTDSYIPSSDPLVNPAGKSGQPQFFTSPELTQCLDLINNLAENTERIPLIKGQEGAGKTTLLFQLQSQSPEHWALCRIDANPMMHPEQLYSQLAQYFGIAEKDDRIKQELLTHFESLRHNGMLPIIAIDDAHLLPVETLIELLQLHTSATSKQSQLLHIILFAAPVIDDLLHTQEAHNVSTQIIQALDIPSLSPEQTKDYITQVLIARGALEAFALTSEQIDKITDSSGGIPGQIEGLLTKLPAHPTTPQKPTERSAFKLLLEDLPITAIIGSLGLISVILLLLVFQDDINALFEEAPTTDKVVETKTERTLEPPTSAGPAAEPSQEVKPTSQATPVEELEPITDIPEQPIATAPPADKLLPQAQRQASKQKPIAPEADTPDPAKTIATVDGKPITADELIPSIPKSVPTPAKTATKPKPVNKGAKQETWLLAQKPSAYTLQVIAFQDKSNILKFTKRHRLAGKIAYFKTTRNGQPWYPLLYGIYPNKAAAIAARPKLSSQLHKKDIWARSLDSVHKEIKAAK